MINKNKSKNNFFTCWLPLSNLNFFHPKSSGAHKFTEGLVTRVLNVLEKNNEFSIMDNSKATLYLNNSHQYFLEDEEKQNEYREKEKLTNKMTSFDIEIISENVSISYFIVQVKYKNSSIFTFTVDEYGFYFFEGDEHLTKKIITEFFGGDFIYQSDKEDSQLEDKYDGILTKNQLVLLLEGVMNCDLYHRYFFKLYDKNEKEPAEKINKEYSIDKLINRILVNHDDIRKEVKIDNIDFRKIENLGILSRYYNFKFIQKIHSNQAKYFNSTLLDQIENEKNKIENYNYEINRSFWENRKNKTNDIAYVLIQDAIEKMTMRKFLMVTEQRPYLQRIKLGIEIARSRMITKIMNLATDIKISQIHYGSEYEDFQFSDDRLEAYTELLLSKVPQLNNIEIMLKNSYYVKIGNTSDVDTINEMESIESFSGYQSWHHTLVSIEKDLKSLSESHQIFNDKKALAELEEIKREETSRNDFNDILSAGEQEKQLYSMSDSDKSYFMIVAVIISLIPKLFSMPSEDFGSSWICSVLSWALPFSYEEIMSFFKGILGYTDIKAILIFFDHIFFSLIFIVFIFLVIRVMKPILSYFYNLLSNKPITYSVMQVIEYRNRDNEASKLRWEKGEKNRNFIRGIGIFLKKFRKKVFDELIEVNKIRMKKTINRISHEEKKVFVKFYTLEGIGGEQLINANIKYLKDKQKTSKNPASKKELKDLEKELFEYVSFSEKLIYMNFLKKTKIKLYIIGSFNMKIHDENIHDIYIDTIKIYYAFNNIENEKYTDEIEEVHEKLESTFNNLFIKKIIKERISDTDIV